MATVFVKMFDPDGDTSGYAISPNGNFTTRPSDLEVNNPKSDRKIAVDDEIGEHLEKFVSSMLVYFDFVPVIMSVAPALSLDAVTHSMRSFLEANSISSRTEDGGTVFEIDLARYRDFSKLTEHLEPSIDLQRTLSRNAMMGLVATLDVHLSDLMTTVLSSIPKSVGQSTEMFSVKQVLSYESYEEFKSAVIQAEVDKVSFKGLDEQVSWFEQRLKIDTISENFARWADLNEVIQRRNLFAHTNGQISKPYLDAGAKFGFSIDKLEIGQHLGVSRKYYEDAVEHIFEFGVLLAHVVRKKIGPKKNPNADKYISELGFRLLVRGNYGLACKILESAYSNRNIDDRTKRMCAVNYANALKFCGKSKTAIEILDEVDWSASSFDFLVCIAAVREDVVGVCRMMKKCADAGIMTEANFREWPVFFHVREAEEFAKTYESVFGIPYIPSPTKRDARTEIFSTLKRQKSLPNPE